MVHVWVSRGRGGLTPDAREVAAAGLGPAFYVSVSAETARGDGGRATPLDRTKGWRATSSPVPPAPPYFGQLLGNARADMAVAQAEARARGFDTVRFSFFLILSRLWAGVVVFFFLWGERRSLSCLFVCSGGGRRGGQETGPGGRARPFPPHPASPRHPFGCSLLTNKTTAGAKKKKKKQALLVDERGCLVGAPHAAVALVTDEGELVVVPGGDRAPRCLSLERLAELVPVVSRTARIVSDCFVPFPFVSFCSVFAGRSLGRLSF